ncbi:MAG: hypothetical protein ACLUGA_07475 [Oscillospiraceae bacterium]|nr:MAG TPA: tail tape measure [Caudoviricetes sp.]
MATQPIKTRFELDGEKEYKAAVSEINASLRVLNSEMKLISEQFKNNDKSVEALTASSDVLSRQILTQKEKIEALQAALKNSAERYGEADARTKRWQTSLNNAQAELVKMERELKANSDAMEKNNEDLSNLDEGFDDTIGSGKGLGDVLDDLTGKLGINLPEGATSTLNSMVSLGGELTVLIGAFAAAAVAVVEVEKALANLTLEQAAAAGEIQDVAMQTGLSTEAVQRYQYACDMIGVSFDTVASSQAKMIRSMADVQSGSETAAATWNQLGIEVMNADGSLRDAQEVFLEVIDVLGQIENATQRDAVSMEIFGRSAQDLNPLIVQGTDAFQAFYDEASDVKDILTDVQLETLAGLDDEMHRVEARFESGANSMALKFTPALQEFYEKTSEGIKGIEEDFAASGLVTVFGSLLELVTALSPAFDNLGEILKACSPVFYGIALVIAGIADGIKVIELAVSSIINLLKLDFSGAVEDWRAIGGTLFGGDNATTRVFESMYNASGDWNFPGGVTWVGENGPERVFLPRGSVIQSAQESARSTGDVYYVTLSLREISELSDIARLARDRRRKTRMMPAEEVD